MARNKIETSELPGKPANKEFAFQSASNVVQAVDMLNEHAEALDALDSDPIEVTGFRDDPESALANLLAALEAKGIITDSTEESAE